MSGRDRLPAPLDAVVRALAGTPATDDERASTFARGLALGALVGAAIAGSTIWQRRHGQPQSARPKSPGTTPPRPAGAAVSDDSKSAESPRRRD